MTNESGPLEGAERLRILRWHSQNQTSKKFEIRSTKQIPKSSPLAPSKGGECPPLALIEYWSIDPDYYGETFRSKWQDYRDNTSNDPDPHHVVLEAKLKVPKISYKRKICVKAVDVFGFESVVVKEIENLT